MYGLSISVKSRKPVEKRTSAAKAVKRAAIYGTAEPVPFVQVIFRSGCGFNLIRHD
jgi:hypothetical protein